MMEPGVGQDKEAFGSTTGGPEKSLRLGDRSVLVSTSTDLGRKENHIDKNFSDNCVTESVLVRETIHKNSGFAQTPESVSGVSRGDGCHVEILSGPHFPTTKKVSLTLGKRPMGNSQSNRIRLRRPWVMGCILIPLSWRTAAEAVCLGSGMPSIHALDLSAMGTAGHAIAPGLVRVAVKREFLFSNHQFT
ncbi:hypothetical protein QYF36_021400 [Acer negundo]|nr:hypothetical protein QYF36_021400 [Acer negundo]